MTAPSVAPPPLDAGELPPKKVAWLHPLQLLRTGYNVWLSTMAKEYIDRRETLAALRLAKMPVDGLPEAVLKRGGTIDASYPKEQHTSELWIDFVADIGDSWEATHAVAAMMAKPHLRVRGYEEPLRRADVVVLGGDLVYPTPSRERYRRRMRSPLAGALPECSNGKAPCLFAIPGNHDWYDGLNSFVREFCQGGALGGWRLMQRRSYFAVKLTPGWWLWGIDIALNTSIDPPQQVYFKNLLQSTGTSEGFVKGDNIILCTAKPAWTDSPERPTEAYLNLNHFVHHIVEKHGGHVRAILAGDLHHYNRYENPALDQMITAGGGGAYMTGTQHLPQRVKDLCVNINVAPAQGANPPQYHAAAFPYPTRADSRRMALGALFLAFRPANWPFVFFVMGALYAIFARNLLQALDEKQHSLRELLSLPLELLLDLDGDVWLMIVIALAVGGFVTAASERSAPRYLTIAWGVVHGFLHLVLAVLLTSFTLRWVGWVDRDRILAWIQNHAMLPARLATVMADVMPGVVFYGVIVFAGGVLGATLVGIYFVVSDMLFAWHTNEVFASQSIINYRNFLRMRIAPDGKLTIFPIGLREVPRKWRLKNTRRAGEPLYEPTDRVPAPHLIEGPITIAPLVRS